MNSALRPALVAALIASASLMQLAFASPVAADDAPQAPAAALLATVEPPHILIVPGTKPNAPTDAVKSLCTPPKAAPELMGTPPYPAIAKELGQEGSVELRFVVEADGNVAAEGLRVTRSSGFPLLDAAARAHLLAGQRFEPANCSGVALRMPHAFRIVFALDEAPGGESCQRPTNVAGLPQQPAYPEGARARREEGTVTLAFMTKDDGSVVARGLTIFLGSGHPELDAAAVLFILKHHFNPAQCDGKPTSSAHNYQVKFELPKPQQ